MPPHLTPPLPAHIAFGKNPNRRYIVEDLRRLMSRVSANEGWYATEWLGIPIWQMPEDLIRLQQAIYLVRPTWIIETGTKYGGSAIFFASMLNLLEQTQGGVITIDMTPNEEAKKNFKTHPQGKLVRDYIIGNAGDEMVVSRVRSAIESVPGPVMVFLDDNHEADHVYSELQLYTPLVTIGSYCIVADTMFEDLAGTPMLDPNSEFKEYVNANPRIALRHFLAQQKNFTQDSTFSGGGAGNFLDGFLKRIS